MSWVGAHLPDDQALAVYQRIDDLAQARRNSGEDPDGPGIDTIRAAVFVDLLLTGDGNDQPAPVNIHVLIDAAGDATTPRLGPITPTTVSGLVEPRGTDRRCRHHHPADPGHLPRGAPHTAGTTTRTTPTSRPNAPSALRNQVCVFPGCVRPTTVCDLDHTVPWPHGPTCICNLGPLCRHHHRLKTHDPGWTLTNHGNGTYTWTTPHNTRHTVTP